MRDAEIRYLFVGEQYQYDNAWKALATCPTLERIIIFDRTVRLAEGDTSSVYFPDFIAGAVSTAETEALVDSRIAGQSLDDLASIIYTSGTTGDSKGVMLSHRIFSEATVLRCAAIRTFLCVFSLLLISSSGRGPTSALRAAYG